MQDNGSENHVMHCTTATSVDLVHGRLGGPRLEADRQLGCGSSWLLDRVVRTVATYQHGPVAHIIRDSDTRMWHTERGNTDADSSGHPRPHFK